MIENYEDKKRDGIIVLDFADSGAIALIERKYNETTGVPEMKPTIEASSKQIDDLLEDLETRITPLLQQKKDLKALLVDVKAKEAERVELAKANMEKEPSE